MIDLATETSVPLSKAPATFRAARTVQACGDSHSKAFAESAWKPSSAAAAGRRPAMPFTAFIAATTAAANGEPMPMPQSAQRRHQKDEAKNTLRRAGITR